MSKPFKFYKNITFYLVLVLIVGVIALFLFLLNGYIMPAYTHHDEGVTVPNITRLSLKDAQKTLKSSGLSYKISAKRSNNAFPPDYVLSQNPPPTKIVKPSRTIYLAVNVIKHPTVKVPELKNLSLRNARIQLQNFDLKMGAISYKSGHFKNTILQQSIKPQKSVKKGTAVDLTVSNGLGKQKVKVPDIKGLKLQKAKKKVRKKGFRVGEIRYKPDSTADSNVVLHYYPKAKKAVSGSTLQLVVSGKPKKHEQSSGIDTTAVNNTTKSGFE